MTYDRKPQACTVYTCEPLPGPVPPGPGPVPPPGPPGPAPSPSWDQDIWMWATISLLSLFVAFTVTFAIYRTVLCWRRRNHRQLRGLENSKLYLFLNTFLVLTMHLKAITRKLFYILRFYPNYSYKNTHY